MLKLDYKELLPLLSKTVNQWLDAPDDRTASPCFIVAEPEIAEALVQLLGQAYDLTAYPRSLNVVYPEGTLSNPRRVQLMTTLTPAKHAIFDASAEWFGIDLLLNTHPDATVFWVHTDADALLASSGDKTLVSHLLGGEIPRIPESLRTQVQELLPESPTSIDWAAARWFAKESAFAAQGLAQDKRVTRISYSALKTDATTTLGLVLGTLQVGFDAKLLGLCAQLPDVPPALPSTDALRDALNAIGHA